ncbi:MULTISPECIES: UDP-glucose--hexose-1-phosphate uridylyltransferase [unclassified Pseudodesulfovibrio]|uniref:UDP-glucose--hexose-1-phosphate uridylyltransferase n=1 Tax=unclassified Pseudodesulfovibrio TaxID=2661612 RepID=UPI000FEB8FBE|nr:MULTISPECIES: UDP-glucose--hexose-1-phosphate uridylyltransferase [unclassified Pseudodesulfovibrio]MCJ2164409.1 UDP-glucose--hexose-1-phosphate uridylyltransferase [Pseudodesulfovibrio sp. S3-i]RWU04615.1 UDP-glucose--hexose-1-phosphate uridylyltransferase [Pseudodesulfovibrio sp. S3]
MQFEDHPHRRLNQLTGEWVLVSPHRTRRPWQGQQEEPDRVALPAYDPGCYLCPGNGRAGGAVNPDYADTFVFTNDFAALLPEPPDDSGKDAGADDLLVAEPETGVCRVICYSPRHDLTLARLGAGQAARVVDVWCAEFAELGGRADIGYVQIFENRGAAMGCSNPHPHGQIWATRSVPMYPATEDVRQAAHLHDRDRCLLCSYLETELARQERVVFENESFVALVPFWALWPFETMILPKVHMRNILEMTQAQRADLADAMVRLNVRYDNLFQTSFPYSMGIHQAPTDGVEYPHWHFHIHYYPPLLRSQSVKKFMVGYEMLAMPQRDLTAEAAAARLREQAEVHYMEAD